MERIEARLGELERQGAIRQTLMDALRSDLDAACAEIGRVPRIASRGNRPSMTDRLHTLENDKTAARAAQAALEAAGAAKRQAWSTWEKAGLFAIAGVGALTSVLRVLGVGG